MFYVFIGKDYIWGTGKVGQQCEGQYFIINNRICIYKYSECTANKSPGNIYIFYNITNRVYLRI